MTDHLKSDVPPPVIVIDSVEEVNENVDHDESVTLHEYLQNSNENVDSLKDLKEPQTEENGNNKSRDDSQTNTNSSRNNSLTKPNLTLQVPAPLQVPVKSSINIADSVTSEASTNVVSADGPSSQPTSPRLGNVTINFNRKENGIINSLRRHGSRETLREEELKHLKEEVRINCQRHAFYLLYLHFYCNRPR